LPRPPSGGLSFGRVGFANTADVSIVREGKRLVIAPSKAAWDGFFDSPGVDLPARDQPALQDRESP
jgi:virulence-associated protein VagC